MAIRGILVFSLLASMVIAIVMVSATQVFSKEVCEEALPQAVVAATKLSTDVYVARLPALFDEINSILSREAKVSPEKWLKEKTKAMVVFRRIIPGSISYVISSYDERECHIGQMSIYSDYPLELDKLFGPKYDI